MAEGVRREREHYAASPAAVLTAHRHPAGGGDVASWESWTRTIVNEFPPPAFIWSSAKTARRSVPFGAARAATPASGHATGKTRCLKDANDGRGEPMTGYDLAAIRVLGARSPPRTPAYLRRRRLPAGGRRGAHRRRWRPRRVKRASPPRPAIGS